MCTYARGRSFPGKGMGVQEDNVPGIRGRRGLMKPPTSSRSRGRQGYGLAKSVGGFCLRASLYVLRLKGCSSS